MAESSRVTNRNLLLAINLILAVVCIAGLSFLIALYPIIRQVFIKTAQVSLNTPRPSLTWSSIPTITLTPTITRTPRPVASSTLTVTPTQTETPTQTSTGTNYPTLTPAQASVLSNAYELIPWSPAEADYMVQLMQGYPATIGSASSSTSSQAYFQAFEIPIFALQESILRFPAASQTDSWEWTLAFDLALAGDPEAGEQYANLIAAGLNRDQTDISQLYAWFQLKEPRMSFFMVEADIPPGFISSYLIELRSAGGSAIIRLLEKNSVFRAESLYTNFDFVNPREVTWILADLNGNTQDGQEIAFYSSSASGETYLNPPQVLNLFRENAVELPFIPAEKIFQVGMDFTNYWGVQSLPSGGNDLVFRTVVFPACPVKLRIVYHWNELYFARVKQEIGFDTLPKDLSYCETMIDHAAYFWGPEVAAGLMEVLTDKWPPTTDQNGEPYPGDAKDEWLYRLAVYYALSGANQAAVDLFNQVSTEPTIPTSRWIKPAQDFLAIWQKPEDIYSACLVAKFCYPADAIKSLVAMLPPSQDASPDALDKLREWGVITTSSGFFDFDRDDETERWFTVRYFPREKLSFWILAKKGNGYTALEITNLDNSRPTLDYIPEAFIADEALQYQPAILLDGAVAFSMQRFPDTQEPYLVEIPLRKEYPSRFFVPLERYKNALLNGASPEVIQQNLVDLADDPGLLCKPTWSCDEYYYLLGLASELARDDPSAVQAYQRLWLDYSKSPYTTMARLKLQLVATPLPAVTPSVTPSPTLGLVTATITPFTLTFTPTGTRITSTPTPTSGTIRPTVSSTPTVTGTPPTATPSPTPTPTETPGQAPPTITPTPTTVPYIPPTAGPTSVYP
jgi:hypothetical protein